MKPKDGGVEFICEDVADTLDESVDEEIDCLDARNYNATLGQCLEMTFGSTWFLLLIQGGVIFICDVL